MRLKVEDWVAEILRDLTLYLPQLVMAMQVSMKHLKVLKWTNTAGHCFRNQEEVAANVYSAQGSHTEVERVTICVTGGDENSFALVLLKQG